MRDIEIGSIRPPSESNSLLIRVTRGCHWNKCYFCGLYKSMRFSMRPIDETIEDIRRQAQLNRGKKITSCFLQDGDALVLKTDYLLRILNTWFEGHKDNIAPTTQESYKYCLKMLKEGFYHRPLTVIRPIDIENFLKGMRRDGRSDSYISKARGMLYQIFQKAEANDLVRRNPVRLAEKMRATGTAKRKEAFTTAEVAHLMKVLPDDRMGLSIRLLLGTGMRMQELLALEPQFIEEDGSVIHIRQAVKVVKGTVSIGSPKSKDSIRDIPVPLNVRPCAIKLRDTTDQFIWESPKTGLPCNPTHFRDVFRKSLEEAGDVRLLTPHSCRHTYVSQMQALGVDIQTIQSIVGHADTEMTEHYLHVQESIRQSAIQLFSEAFSA